MNKIKYFTILLSLLIIVYSCKPAINNKSATTKVSENPIWKLKHSFKFLIISDWGWNGAKHQQEVADEMGIVADSIGPKFIVTCGDNFQINGVASTQDPLWAMNFENVYKNPSLQEDWYPVFGNHDYKGNTQAEIDYLNISRRWRMISHYYSFKKKINDSISALFIFIDTPPLVSEYHEKSGYPDIEKQDTTKQLAWLKDVLSNSKEQWKLVFGHHPVFSASNKHGNTPEMIQKIKPLLEKYKVQYYFCGHDHDFQHLKEKSANVNYIVTGTGGDTRPASTNDLSIFSKSVPGFSVVSFVADSIHVYFVDTKGSLVYSTQRTYR